MTGSQPLLRSIRMHALVAGAIVQARPDVEPRALLRLCRDLASLWPRDEGAFHRIVDAAIGVTAEDLHRGERLLAVFLLRGDDERLPPWAADAFFDWLRAPWGVMRPAPHPWLAAERARRLPSWVRAVSYRNIVVPTVGASCG